MEQQIFANTQILTFNPILNENTQIQTKYFLYFKKLLQFVKWNRGAYTKAQINFYKEILCSKNSSLCTDQNLNNNLPDYACYLIPYDVALMILNKKIIHKKKITIIVNKIVRDFKLSQEIKEFLYKSFDAAFGDKKAWDEILNNNYVKKYKKYLEIVKDNIFFIKKRPYKILVTATMSAGKSTLVNSLVGKNICRMQNMACTSKIHTIVSKHFEDGITSKYDYNFSINVPRDEISKTSKKNLSNQITISTYFNSSLNGQRIILFDSPGVNSNPNIEHREISEEMINSKNYDLLIYVLNATQLGTNDEEIHLETVKNNIGQADILFVL